MNLYEQPSNYLSLDVFKLADGRTLLVSNAAPKRIVDTRPPRRDRVVTSLDMLSSSLGLAEQALDNAAGSLRRDLADLASDARAEHERELGKAETKARLNERLRLEREAKASR